jgi:hypothetical protein
MKTIDKEHDMRRIVFLVFLGFLGLAGCKATLPMRTDTYREVSQKEVVRHVDVEVAGDTAVAVYRLIAEPQTDGAPAGTVRLEQVSEKRGTYTQAPRVRVENGQLVITAVAAPQIIPVEVVDTYTTEKEVTVKTEIITTNELTAWQNIRVWIGNIFIVFLFLLIVVQILRVKKILKI